MSSINKKQFYVKRVISGIPTSATTTLRNLSDVSGTPSSANNVLLYDSASDAFTFGPVSASSVGTVNGLTGSISIVGGTGIDVTSVGSTITVTATGEGLDSAQVLSLIDSDYVLGLIGSVGGLDSAQTVSLIENTVDSAYVQARVGTVTGGTDSATVRTIADEQIGLASIGDLVDVDLTGVATGKILKYDSNRFIVADDEAVGTGLDSASAIELIDSAYINARVDAVSGGTDSAAVIGLIDSAYVQARVTLDGVGIDSGAVIGLIDSAYVQARVTLDGVGIDSADVVGIVDQTFINNLNIDAVTLGGNDSSHYLDYNNFTNTPSILDSGDVTGIIDSAYVQARVTIPDGYDSAKVQGQFDSSIATTSIFDFADVRSGVISDGQILKWSDSEQKFIIAADLLGSSGAGGDAATLGGQLPAFYLNFGNLTNVPNILDSADVALIASFDSNEVVGMIDSAYVQARVTLDGVGIDSNQAINLIDSAYVQARVTLDGVGIDSATAQGFADSAAAAVTLQTITDNAGGTTTGNISVGGVTVTGEVLIGTLTPSTDSAAATKSYVDASIAGFSSYDSALVQGQIDSAVSQDFVRAFIDQSFIDTFDTHDSGAVQGQIDSALGALDTHDSAAIQQMINITLAATDTHDSAAVQGQIDSSLGLLDTHDSAAVQGQIDSALGVLDTHDSAAVLGQINATVTQSFINQFDTHDSAAVQAQIDSAVNLSSINALGVDADTVDGIHASQFLRSDADDTTTGNLTVQGNITTSNLITFEGDSATVANLTTAIVATASMSTFNAIEATIVSVNATGGDRQVSRVLLTHDTSDTYMNEYAVINTGATDQFTVDADTNSGNFRLKIDNVSGNTLFAKSSISYI